MGSLLGAWFEGGICIPIGGTPAGRTSSAHRPYAGAEAGAAPYVPAESGQPERAHIGLKCSDL